MPRGRHTTVMITLTPKELTWLLSLQRRLNVPAGLVRRARAVLCVAKGMTITETATTVGMSRRHTYKWLKRWCEQGQDGLIQ